MKGFARDTRRIHGLTILMLLAVALCGCSSDNGTTQPPTTLEPPSSLSYINGVNSVTLTWSASPDVGSGNFAGYAVYRDTTSMLSYTDQKLTTVRLNSTPTLSTSYTDTGATNGKKYFYAVRAVNDKGGISTPTNEIDTAARPEFINLTVAEFAYSGHPSGIDLSAGQPVSMRSENAGRIDVYLGTAGSDDPAGEDLVLKSPSLVNGGGDPAWQDRVAGLQLLGSGDAAWNMGTAPSGNWVTQVNLGATADEAVGKVIAVRTPGTGSDVHYAKLRVTGSAPAGPNGERSLLFKVAYQEIPNYIRFRR